MDRKVNRRIARRQTPLYAGRGAGYHRDRSKYTRKRKHAKKEATR